MLEAAILHTEELNRLIPQTAYEDKYKYLNCGWIGLTYKPKEDNWQGNEFVSVHKHGRVTGYIAYEIHRQAYKVNNFVMMNFTNDKVTFGKDLLQAIMDIFLKFGFNKMNFMVHCGNPIERSYDRLVERLGGRISGYYQDEVKLSDGTYCDSKSYEITLKDFLGSKFYYDYKRYKNRREV
jgi:hypothetical protein